MNLTTKLNEAETELLKRIGFDIKNNDLSTLSEDEHGEVYDVLDKYMFDECLNDEGFLTKEGELCEDIFYKLANV